MFILLLIPLYFFAAFPSALQHDLDGEKLMGAVDYEGFFGGRESVVTNTTTGNQTVTYVAWGPGLSWYMAWASFMSTILKNGISSFSIRHVVPTPLA